MTENEARETIENLSQMIARCKTEEEVKSLLDSRKIIPLKPIEREWKPNLCPNCFADLGGECCDGYYKNPHYDYCPECFQRLNYHKKAK